MGTGTVTPRPATYDADYIVVGSGAGGGTVAARLAESGFRVLLIEAGGDPRKTVGSTPQTPGINSLPDDYDVPAFHPLSAENDGIRWDFFVRHYEDQARQEQDPKYRSTFDGKPVDGVLYPRAGTLGGCTAHNAMILVYPHNADWNQLADLTGDASWRAEKMRSYFERLERCEHRPDERATSRPATIRADMDGQAGCRRRRADAARGVQGQRSSQDAARYGARRRCAVPKLP